MERQFGTTTNGTVYLKLQLQMSVSFLVATILGHFGLQGNVLTRKENLTVLVRKMLFENKCIHF